MIDTSNMTKARYQPIFFVPVYTKIEGSMRDYGVTAAERSVGKRMEVSTSALTVHRPINRKTSKLTIDPCEIFHSVGTFPLEFLWHFLHSWLPRAKLWSEIVRPASVCKLI